MTDGEDARRDSRPRAEPPRGHPWLVQGRLVFRHRGGWVLNCFDDGHPRLVLPLDGLRYELGDRAWWAFVKPKTAATMRRG